MFRQKLKQTFIKALEKAVSANALGQMQTIEDVNIAIEKPKNTGFGDFAINVSSLSRYAKLPPIKIAETLKSFINIEDCEINVVNGFINFKLGKSHYIKAVKEILKEDFGKNNLGKGEKVLLEYVSGNPTGPLHIGHGRWAAVGSSLANILKYSGYDVTQEFYINDAGNQIANLAKSMQIRVRQELGEDIDFPAEDEKNYYRGEYLIPLAKEFVAKCHPEENEVRREDLMEEISIFTKEKILNSHKELLEKFKTNFDVWFKESSLYETGEIDKCLKKIEKDTYRKDGATWFKSTKYGDDQDRVIRKADGSFTYLTPDIAYHYNKLQRGYTKLINIWGADHHGYIPRIKGAIEALGFDSDCLEVLLGQLVNLIIDGEQMRMGKRKKMLTLEELIDEVGVDATRFWMVIKSIDTALDFDVNLAKSNTDENPVFYAQYAHARCCSILRNATAEGLNQDTGERVKAPFSKNVILNLIQDLSSLSEIFNQDEKSIKSAKKLILKLESFEDIVYNSAKNRKPYLIANYSVELATVFHHFYSFSRVLSEDKELSKARLSLVIATKTTLAKAFSLLSIEAIEKM